MKRLLFILLLLPLFSQAQIITTIAGNGIPAYTGDGGLASAAQIDVPGYVSIDGTGNLYITDEGNNAIRIINSLGIIHTIAGTGTAGYIGDGSAASAAQLNLPKGVVFDQSGNIYIADGYNYAIRKINTSGIISTIAGNGTAGYTGDGGPATVATLGDVHAVAVDRTGNVYIADFDNSVVRKVNTSGIISTFAGNGTLGYSGDGGPATAAEFNNPTGLVFDSAGNLYIADARSQVVRKVNTSGIISTFAGNGVSGYSGDGSAATAAEFYLPHAVAIDDSGNIYICDAGNNRIRKVNTSGIVITIAGNGAAGYSGDGGQATAAEVSSPYGTAIDSHGDVYIADLDNNRIREIVKDTSSALQVTSINTMHTMMLYPNPATTSLTISSTYQPINEITIFNLLGQTVYGNQYNTHQAQVDVSAFSPGVYFVKVNGVDVRKFVKE